MKLSSLCCRKRYWCRCRRRHNYYDEKGVDDNNNHHHHDHDDEKEIAKIAHYVKKTSDNSYITTDYSKEEEEIDIVDTTNWMSKILDSTLLINLVLPGSHDAGMSEAHDVTPSIAKSKVIQLTQTQNLSILNQLKAGSRYLDLRVDLINNNSNSNTKSRTKSKSSRSWFSSSGNKKNENSNNNPTTIQQQQQQLLLVTYHRNSHKLGMDGQSLTSIFDQIHQFLTQVATSETIIIKFSHIGGGIDENCNETKMKLVNFLSSTSKYQDLIYTSKESNNINLLKLPLGLIRGKIVIVMDYDEFIDPTHGRFRYRDYFNNQGQQTTNIRVYDHYSNTDSVQIMSNDQLTKWKKSMITFQQQSNSKNENENDKNDDYMFLLSWTLTPQGIWSSSVEKLANKANRTLKNILHKQIIQQHWKPPNIVYIDYITPQLGTMIVQYNFTNSKK